MPQNVGNVTLDTSVLDHITAQMEPEARKVVNKYGLIIASQAAQNAPVDTAALRNSLLSESGMTDDLTYTVRDGVTYGIFQELGTSKMAAQPFLVPALETWRDKFLKAFEGLFK
jgi:HK97 gp10 family phage protein